MVPINSMKKIYKYLSENILFIITLFLLAFVPLYPKLPLINVNHTWVYVRLEDFFVLFAIIVWAILLFKRKVTFKTPLTMPILAFWIIGAIATIHGVLIIFPGAANVFPNVAFFAYLRHIEYLGIFFVAFSSMKDKKSLPIAVTIVVLTLIGVVLYGLGQKYLGFPAYLTMNEEYAKGLAIRLSSLSRVPSTFAGHYDLAAYLVLVVPILASMFFGVKNWFLKLFFLFTSFLGFGLLFMTVSRVSFFVLIVVLFLVLFFYKKRFVLFSLPLVALLAFIFLSFQPSLLDRFGNTVREVDVLVDATTGNAIGNVSYVPLSYFQNKILKQKLVSDKEQLDNTLTTASEGTRGVSLSELIVKNHLPSKVPLVRAQNISNGETLPQGTGYINLSISPVTKQLTSFFYETDPNSTTVSGVYIFSGKFLIKRAAAYDLSFTTRFQGEWPHALETFQKNVLVGSGYGSVSLAVDNNYLRMLGEIGLLGLASFLAIFLSAGIYIAKTLPSVGSRVTRSFTLGFVAGVVGLILNATLIDVFEASKIAFLLWMLTGVTLGALYFETEKRIDIYQELKKAARSSYAAVAYLLIGAIAIFSPTISNYFSGEDFTWFRISSVCGKTLFNAKDCFGLTNNFINPGAKIYFNLMYSVFWLNQVVYHLVSTFLHLSIVILFFLLARKILKNNLLSLGAAFLFLLMSGYLEAVFWISSSGFLFSCAFVLSSLLLFIEWNESKKLVYYLGAFIFFLFSLFFHDLGIVTPFLMVLYAVFQEGVSIKKLGKNTYYLLLTLPSLLYVGVKLLQFDFTSINYFRLPINVIVNFFGYILTTIFGSVSIPFYRLLEKISSGNMLLSILLAIVMFASLLFVFVFTAKYIDKEEKRIWNFGIWFFALGLIPFLFIERFSPSYSYLASMGIILILVVMIKKLYGYLLTFGKDIGVAVIAVLVAVFGLFNIIQLQQSYMDWHGAGEKVKNFYVSIDSLYSDYWSTEPVEFYFIDVPATYGSATVFPTGTIDALWFAFKNKDLKVYEMSSLSEALSKAGNSPAKRVFKFRENGGVTEVERKNVRPYGKYSN